jgi:hypothetical protein
MPLQFRSRMTTEEAVLAFVRGSIRSAWALEMLLLLRRDPQRAWSAEALVAELRGSVDLLNQSAASLAAAGLVDIVETGQYVYRPRASQLAELVDALAELYAHKPVAVLSTIFSAPADRIRSFADAFLFKRK